MPNDDFYHYFTKALNLHNFEVESSQQVANLFKIYSAMLQTLPSARQVRNKLTSSP